MRSARLPFFSQRRLVIVEEADTFVTKYRKDLEAYVGNPSAHGDPALAGEAVAGEPRSWPRLVEKIGLSINASAPREAELVAWLTQLARARFGAQLTADGARLLVELVGPEAGILAAEVEKLAVYAGRFPTRSNEATSPNWWAPAASRRSGRPSTRPRPARRVRRSSTSTTFWPPGSTPSLLLAAMSASLLKIHHAGRLRAARLNLDEACRIAGIPPRSPSTRPASNTPTWALVASINSPPCSCRPTSTSREAVRSIPARSSRSSSSASANREPTEGSSPATVAVDSTIRPILWHITRHKRECCSAKS